MGMDNRLGDYLRARREATSPDAVADVTPLGRRRTPGLRREEVAMLGGISINYYVRLEQGREANPSPQVLNALIGVFDLGPAAAEHLYALARPQPPRSTLEVGQPDVGPHLSQMMQGWIRQPAYIVTPWSQVLASNALARELFADFEPTDNMLRMVFLDPAARRFYVDWESTAREIVSGLHNVIGADLDNPRAASIIGELSIKSHEFRRWWALHEVAEPEVGTKRLHHSEVGALTLSWETLTINSSVDQYLVVYHAEPGSPTEQALDLLGALAATRAPRPHPTNAEPG